MSFGRIINFNFSPAKKRVIYTDKYTITFISNYDGLFRKDAVRDFLKSRGCYIDDIYISENMKTIKELSPKLTENEIYAGNCITFKIKDRNDIYLFYPNENDYISVYIEEKQIKKD